MFRAELICDRGRVPGKPATVCASHAQVCFQHYTVCVQHPTWCLTLHSVCPTRYIVSNTPCVPRGTAPRPRSRPGKARREASPMFQQCVPNTLQVVSSTLQGVSTTLQCVPSTLKCVSNTLKCVSNIIQGVQHTACSARNCSATAVASRQSPAGSISEISPSGHPHAPTCTCNIDLSQLQDVDLSQLLRGGLEAGASPKSHPLATPTSQPAQPCLMSDVVSTGDVTGGVCDNLVYYKIVTYITKYTRSPPLATPTRKPAHTCLMRQEGDHENRKYKSVILPESYVSLSIHDCHIHNQKGFKDLNLKARARIWP